MKTGMRQIATTASGLALAALLAGCTTPGPLTARRTTMGTLRTSVANLEHQNQQLKSELANLHVENRQVADRLVEAEEDHKLAVAKLEDARRAIRGEGDTSLADSSTTVSEEAPPPRRREGPRTSPAGRSSRSARKPPFARIPNRIDDAPALANPEDEPEEDAPVSRRPRGVDLGPQSRNDRPSRWLPVGRGERALR